jgi:Mg-chelatase subunit ChlD
LYRLHLGDPEYFGEDAIKPTNEELEEEVNEMAGKLYGAGMSLLVIDTEVGGCTSSIQLTHSA